MRRYNKLFLVICLVFGMLFAARTSGYARTQTSDYQWTNENTGYIVIIEDDAGLLRNSEINELADTMMEVTLYGNAAFKTIDNNTTSTESYIKSYYREMFGTSSGTVFLIDMDNRNIWIYSDGSVYKTVTTAYANTITDNVYTYASAGEYFACANKAFSQINTLLAGHNIRQPMKYISNALLALISALLINYVFVAFYTKLKRPSNRELMNEIKRTFSYTSPEVKLTNTTRVYSPQSDSSDGGSSSSGGGGGGGGSSGGGGGHSF